MSGQGAFYTNGQSGFSQNVLSINRESPLQDLDSIVEKKYTSSFKVNHFEMQVGLV